MDKSIIKVRSMSFKYADKYIFKDFDMDIDTNSFVCIIGRNASGKSTLVKILGGLCKASGYINVDGYLLNDTYIKKIRRSLAICFDDADRHFIGDTVFDDLAFSLENLGYFPKEIENMVNNIDDTLEKMGFNLPFIVKLSHNLMLYDVLDKVYFDDVEVMKKLWG